MRKIICRATKVAAIALPPLFLIGCEQVSNGAPAPAVQLDRTVNTWNCSNARTVEIRNALAAQKLRTDHIDGLGTDAEKDIAAEKWKARNEDVIREAEDITYFANAFYECPLNIELQVIAASGAFDDDNVISDIQKKVIVQKLKFALDTKYKQFESALLRGDRDARVLPAAIDLVLPILGITETINGTEYAAAALLRGGYDIYKDKFLGGQTTELIVSQMRKDRKEIWKVVEGGANGDYDFADSQSISQRDLSATLRMLPEYQNAGSFFSAIEGIREAVQK